MARFINIATIHFQTSERGDDPRESALAQFREAEAKLDGTHIDLVVTCEGMESVGQTMKDAESASRPGPLFNAYRNFAMRNHCTIAGSIKLEDGGKIYNALVYIGPDGKCLGDYRKSFPTQGEMEDGFTPGGGANVVETPAGRLGGVICFDLNFGELRDAYRKLRPDVLCFSSMFHGGHLQQNWAYQCRCYFAAACKDHTSNIIDPHGRILNATSYYGRISRARVNLDRFFMHLDINSNYFPEIMRKYGNRIFIDSATDLGTAVLYSLDDNITAKSIADEFKLIEIDDFFNGARNAVKKCLNSNSKKYTTA